MSEDEKSSTEDENDNRNNAEEADNNSLVQFTRLNRDNFRVTMNRQGELKKRITCLNHLCSVIIKFYNSGSSTKTKFNEFERQFKFKRPLKYVWFY